MCIVVCMFVKLCGCIVGVFNSLHWVNRVLSIHCVWEEFSVIDVRMFLIVYLLGVEHLES